MVFTSPTWVPQLPSPLPDSISIHQFMSGDNHGAHPHSVSKNLFTCGLTGKSYTASEVIQREEYAARAISKRLNFNNETSDWDRVVSVFSLNTIDYIPLTHAIHRCLGIVTPANPSYGARELEQQLRSSNAIALFACASLLETALEAARAVGLSHDRIFMLPMHDDGPEKTFPTMDQLVSEGKELPEVSQVKWSPGQGARQVAYLCYSSGTSGLPKAVMISHHNVIANVLQLTAYESVSRKTQGVTNQTVLACLPFSHIYGLVLMGHLGPYRGDETVVLPKYNLKSLLAAVQRYKIEQLNVVPPILVQIIARKDICKRFDLSSVRFVFTGGAPLASETIHSVLDIYPSWHIGQAFGMTETATIITGTSESDIFPGSSGSLLPSIRAKLIGDDGNEVTEYETAGELLIQGLAVTLGYLNNEKATAETFVWHDDGRWIRTGDRAIFRKVESGNEHLFIIDRIKELIKGMQVAPAELEAHILTHPWVSDCAVIEVPHEMSGEVPKAFIVRSPASKGQSEQQIADAVSQFVKEHKAHYKWLVGGVEFIAAIPKNPTGKILRRLLRDREREARKMNGPMPARL